MKKIRRRVPVTVDLPVDTVRTLDRIAKQTNVSTSKLCEILIVLYLESRGL